MKCFVCFLATLLCLWASPGFSQEKTAPEPPTEKPPADAPEPPNEDAATSKREPFRITREFEAQQEEVEPPEIEVKGIMEAKGKTVALARLQLEKVEGRVVLEPGMRVSIPKPDREASESDRWMTYFTVRSISKAGMVIVLENGEVVWYPVMGQFD